MAPATKQTPPVPSKLTFGYCPTNKTMTVGAPRVNLLYYKYYFNEELGQLLPLECLECQPTIQEKHLYPLYSVYVDKIGKHVIFAYNIVTSKVEQYVFNPVSAGFEEIYYPHVQFNNENPLTDVICTVEGNGVHGLTLIMRTELGTFKKLRYVHDLNNYVSITPVYVKTLVMKDLENMLPRPASGKPTALSQKTPFFGNETSNRHEFPPFIHQFCNRIQKEVLCVKRKDGSYLRLVHNYTTGDFETVNCDNCIENILEQNLYPIYAAFSNALNKKVLFVRNHLTFKVEQYIFCPIRNGFEQVDIPEFRYQPHRYLEPTIRFKVKHPDTGHFIQVCTDEDGRILKNLLSSNHEFCKQLEPGVVVTLRMKKEAKEKRRRDREMEDLQKEKSNSDSSSEMIFLNLLRENAEDTETMKEMKRRYNKLSMETEQMLKDLKFDNGKNKEILSKKLLEIASIEQYLNQQKKTGASTTQSIENSATSGSSSFEYDFVDDLKSMNISEKP